MAFTKTLTKEQIDKQKSQKAKTILFGLRPNARRSEMVTLLSPNFEIEVVENGLELVRKIPHVKPSLIVLESDIPRLSGFQIAQLVKGHPKLQKIPLIIIISQGYQIGEFWSKEVGVDYCQAEPNFSPPQLVRIAEKFAGKFNPSQITDDDWAEIRKNLIGDGVLTEISNILDEKLFETTIINHIALLAQRTTTLKNLLRSIMVLLREILEFSAGAIHIFKKNEIFTLLEKEIREDEHALFLFEVYEYGDIYRETKEQDLREGYLEVPLGNFPSMDHRESENPTIFTIPLEAHKKTLGTITIKTFKAAVKRDYYLRTLELISKQTALALDNALLYQEVHRLSTIDELTGLPNRREFIRLFEAELTRTKRFRTHMSLAICDIDHFKSVNDTYGHVQGDHVLVECARIFTSSVREKIDIVARFGGEEFVILLPQTDMEKARAVMERLRLAIQNNMIPKVEGDGLINVTVSVGLTSIDGNSDLTIDEVINAADKMLYIAKENGRNRTFDTESYDPNNL